MILTVALSFALLWLGEVAERVPERDLYDACIGARVERKGHVFLVTTSTSSAPPATAPVPVGTWTNRPDSTFRHDDWFYALPSGEVCGEARQFREEPWKAFVGGAYCGSGTFMTGEAARACVERACAARPHDPWNAR